MCPELDDGRDHLGREYREFGDEDSRERLRDFGLVLPEAARALNLFQVRNRDRFVIDYARQLGVVFARTCLAVGAPIDTNDQQSVRHVISAAPFVTVRRMRQAATRQKVPWKTRFDSSRRDVSKISHPHAIDATSRPTQRHRRTRRLNKLTYHSTASCLSA